MATHDRVIRGGTVVDGTTAPARTADVAITGGVIREVGLVDVREEGRRRIYRVNGRSLKPIHDWVVGYEQAWTERFDRLDAVLEDLTEEERKDGHDDDDR